MNNHRRVESQLIDLGEQVTAGEIINHPLEIRRQQTVTLEKPKRSHIDGHNVGRLPRRIDFDRIASRWSYSELAESLLTSAIGKTGSLMGLGIRAGHADRGINLVLHEGTLDPGQVVPPDEHRIGAVDPQLCPGDIANEDLGPIDGVVGNDGADGKLDGPRSAPRGKQSPRPGPLASVQSPHP